MSRSHLPFRKAIRIIVLSTVLISGTAAVILSYYFHVRALQINDSHYEITSIKQQGPLGSDFIAEWLDLSVDSPKNIYRYDTEEGRQKLLDCPFIRDAYVKKQKPGALEVRYLLREPIAKIGDYTNCAIDWDGVLFPYETTALLPTIILGESEEFCWGKVIDSPRFNLALKIIDQLQDPTMTVDMSLAEAPSFGQREIIVTLQRGEEKEYLRLSPEHYQEGLAKYSLLQEYLTEQKEGPVTTFDLRIPDLAFLD